MIYINTETARKWIRRAGWLGQCIGFAFSIAVLAATFWLPYWLGTVLGLPTGSAHEFWATMIVLTPFFILHWFLLALITKAAMKDDRRH